MSTGRRLRILLDGSPLQDGRRTAGIGRYVQGVSEALRRLDAVDTDVVVPRPPRRDSWLVRYLAAQPALAWAAVRTRPTLVHGMASDPVAGFPLRRQVVTVHDVVPWTKSPADIGHRTAWYLAAQRRRLRSVAAVIAVSPGVAGDVERVLGVRAERIHVVPNGVAPVFTPAPGPDDDTHRAGAGATRYVLWVGSLRSHDERKALDTLIAAVAAATAAPRLVLAGAAGDESTRVRASAAERSVDAVLTGYVSDERLAALYRGAAAVLLPSLDEGFGLPALEAMACGTPVITSRGTNTAALVCDGGLLADAADPRSVATAIDAVLGDAELAARLGRAGTRIAGAYTWDRAAELTVDVYHAAHGASRG